MPVATNRARPVLLVAALLAGALGSSAQSAAVAPVGYVLSWGDCIVPAGSNAVPARIERLVDVARSQQRVRGRTNSGIRIVGPDELLAMGGAPALAFSREVYRWMVLVPLGKDDRFFWVTFAPDRAGLALRWGVWYPSQTAYLVARAQQIVLGFLPPKWCSAQSRLLHAFEEGLLARQDDMASEELDARAIINERLSHDR